MFYVLMCGGEYLLIVFNFLLSSPRFDHEDSDSEWESFQKIYGETFWLAQIFSHGAKTPKTMKILHEVTVWDQKLATGPALRAMFKINMAGRDCSEKTLALK